MTVRGLANDLKPFPLEQGRQTLPDDGMIVREKDPAGYWRLRRGTAT